MSERVLLVAMMAIAGMIAAPAAGQTQGALNAAADRQWQAADRALNTQYMAAAARLSAPARLLLRNAQRSWITFRDRECLLEASDVTGGTAYAMVHSGCLTRLTTDRTEQLKTLARCEEGDLSCPR